jgi:hypothetical protein
MSSVSECSSGARPGVARFFSLPLAVALLAAGACAPAVTTTTSPVPSGTAVDNRASDAPMPDPRVGLRAGLTDAGRPRGTCA